MSKFSVNKPYTVLVGVIMIIILGIISFTNLTTDLLPSMELPYVAIITTYPGATPEKVEEAVSKPIEQGMMSISNISNVTSNSEENYSMVLLEFDGESNMDSIMIEISQELDVLETNLEEGVATPTVMQINPDMMPILMTAVDMEGLSSAEITEFVENTLKLELESVPGVASVDTYGAIENNLSIKLNQDKINSINDRMLAGVNSELANSKADLDKAQNEINSGKSALNATKTQKTKEIAEGISQVESGRNEITKAEIELSAQKAELDAQKQQLESAMNTFNEQIAVNPEMAELIRSNENYIAIVSGLEMVNAGLAQINEAQNQINAKKAQLDATSSTLEVAQSTLINEITKAETDLNTAEQGVKEGLEQFNKARDEALANASIDGIITTDMISQILTAENFSMPAGYVNEDIIVKVGDKFNSIDEIKNLVLFSFDIAGLEEVKLDDVADIEVGDNSSEVYAKVNGNNGIVLSFSKQSTASTKDVSSAIQEKMTELEEKYDNISFTNLMDQGVYIDMIISSVMNSLVVGGLLAIIVLFLFLKEWKTTVIVAVSIPISLVFAIAMMYFSGITINIMSLSGLALGVGMLVDNSIVVIENIFRLRKEGKDIKDAAIEGAKKVAGAIIASTLTTICVFLPIVFVHGMSRQLFTDIGLTIAYSLIASLIMALTLVPAMASKMLNNVTDKENKLINKIVELYSKLLSLALRFKPVVIILVVVLLGTSFYLTTKMEVEFIPSVESDEMSISITMPDEATSEDAKTVSDTIIERILQISDISKVGALDMSSSSNMMMGSSSGISMYIVLDENRTMTNEEIAKKITELTGDLKAEIEISTSDMDMSAMMASGVSVKITGNDLDKLKEISGDIENKLSQMEGIDEIDGVTQNSSMEKRITINKNEAMKHNLTVAGIYSTVSNEIKTETEGAVIEIDNKDYQLIIKKADNEVINVDNLMDIELKDEKKDENIKLSEVATVADDTGLESISRENNKRYVTVNCTIKEDYSTTMVSREVEDLVHSYEPETGYLVEIEGELDSTMEYIQDLLLMIFVAILFIYLIMVAQFQSLKFPFIVMFTIPLAFTGGLLALFFTGQAISIIAMLGFLVLSGIVVNNGIVFIDCVNQLKNEQGLEKVEAIKQTGKLRLRPILMTALTTILGLTSMALGIGKGTEMTQPLGIVAIGGLIYSTLLTLFLIPVLYDLFDRKRK